MPVTFVTFLVGSLALAGVPGFAGFFSKDAILSMAYFSKYPWGKEVWFVGLVVVFLTSFYTFRLVFRAFFGEFKGPDDHYVHESPKVMTIPLVILAIAAIVTGFLGIPEVLGGHPYFYEFLRPVLGSPEVTEAPHSVEYGLMLLSIGMCFAGILAAYIIYLKKPSLQYVFPRYFRRTYNFLYRKWYFDEVYDLFFVRSALWIGRWIITQITDNIIIEGIINGIAWIVRLLGRVFSYVQSGVVNYYGVFVLVGLVIYFAVYLFLR